MLPNATKKLNHPTYLKDLILLFAVPIGIAIFAAAVIYIPRLFANPKYDFIYSVCNGYSCSDNYTVDAGGLVSKDYSNLSDQTYYNSSATIRYYDAKNDSSKSLTIEEAHRYRLNTSSKSPDGYNLTKEETSSGFLFWGEYNNGWYLKNGAKKKKVELSNSSPDYTQNIKFLGWVNK